MRRSGFAALLGAALAVFFSFTTSEAQQASLESKFPKNWTGEFRWTSAPYVQRYDITLTKLKQLAPSRIEGIGCGRNAALGHTTNINVRIVIDEKTRAVEIFESDPTTREFTTDGSHRGKLAKDLKSMQTEWRTRGTGQQGKMQLHAGGEEISCPAGVST